MGCVNCNKSSQNFNSGQNTPFETKVHGLNKNINTKIKVGNREIENMEKDISFTGLQQHIILYAKHKYVETDLMQDLYTIFSYFNKNFIQCPTCVLKEMRNIIFRWHEFEIDEIEKALSDIDDMYLIECGKKVEHFDSLTSYIKAFLFFINKIDKKIDAGHEHLIYLDNPNNNILKIK